MENNSNKKGLEETIKEIEKKFGKGSIMKLNDKPNKENEVISTGSLSLDIALGIGGYAKGRIIELFGPESSGKTTLALHAVVEAQKAGGNVAFIDAEHALDAFYAKSIGIDMNKFYLSQPNSGEQALDIAFKLIDSGHISLLIVDSVAALVPEAELVGDMSSNHIGLQARMMGQAMRKQSGIIAKTNTIVIYINQLREKTGIMFGNPEITPGGKALKFFSSMRLDIRKAETIKEGHEITGIRSKIKILKSKLSPPLKIAMIDIIYGKGISKVGEVVEIATKHNLMQKNGSWYNYKGEKIAQGYENTKKYLIDNPKIYHYLLTEIKKIYNIWKN
ncbi:recombinase RecA [Candidatus Phytoplasma meliae]|uniref:Protein RecA n=1 Tax=Candidatus Phytoplasma meliae TaxID=1848402 RepID=A0ABS5CYM9_9MOLU|nr:recombinase RecA [Candidatus Phytoplasma meliae]MBP5836080.1 recombinase RecA [Candidatus Phytoplasma meliae]